MRGAKGKLICIWSPVIHGEGCSTLACGVGIGLQYFSDKKVLIVNVGNSANHMERYLEGDIEIKYSMDNLRIFNNEIRTEHILTYATQINKDLYIIAGSRLNREVTGNNKGFDNIFIEKCLAGFDIVIADLDIGVSSENRLYLERADIILPVATPNEIVMDELFDNRGAQETLDYFSDEKAVNIINKLWDGWETAGVTRRYKNRYSLSYVFGLNYNGDVINACCTDKNFYSFLMKEIKRDKSIFVKQLNEICTFLIERLYGEKSTVGAIKQRNFFRKFLRSSIY